MYIPTKLYMCTKTEILNNSELLSIIHVYTKLYILTYLRNRKFWFLFLFLIFIIITKIARSRTWNIFIQDLTYCIVIQGSLEGNKYFNWITMKYVISRMKMVSHTAWATSVLCKKVASWFCDFLILFHTIKISVYCLYH